MKVLHAKYSTNIHNIQLNARLNVVYVRRRASHFDNDSKKNVYHQTTNVLEQICWRSTMWWETRIKKKFNFQCWRSFLEINVLAWISKQFGHSTFSQFLLSANFCEIKIIFWTGLRIRLYTVRHQWCHQANETPCPSHISVKLS